jgi:hypothetical protein
MMIPYVEIIQEYKDGTLRTFSYVEPIECWFELSYQGVGEFEIYCSATRKNLKALKKGCYVKLPNRRYGWIITSVQYDFNAERRTRTISAKGYELKWLLKKRIIQKSIQLSTNLFQAVHGLVDTNIGEGASEARRIPHFKSLQNDEVITIPETQATRGNLLKFVNTLLKAHSCGSTVFFEKDGTNTLEMHFEAYKGQEKQNSVRFSQSYDNLLSSSYYSSDEDVGTFALVVSEEEVTKVVNEEEVKEDIEILREVGGGQGLDRAEILIESSLSTKYEDANGEEKELDLANESDLATFKTWQEEEGKKELATHTTIEEVNGEVDLENSLYKFDEDFFLGDKVKVQDEHFDFFIETRISKVTIKQDSSGYGEEIEYNE